MRKFDYIIAGAGAAGLTLTYLLMDCKDKEKSILIIDKDLKSTNDRTWCFWEEDENLFENLVYKKWSKAKISTSEWSETFKLTPYAYKMIRGIDFYEFMKKELNFPQITWVQETISKIDNNGLVITDQSTYEGKYVFDSTFKIGNLIESGSNTILQHFKGKIVKTSKDIFDPDIATYMDFSIDQEGDCRFGYVLPFSSNTALVEYTLFNKQLLNENEYEKRLEQYFSHLNIENYEVLEEEYGVIPMTDHFFRIKQSEHVFNIGINGGFAKASTGYTFLRTQKILKKMVQNMEEGVSPDQGLPFQQKRFKMYDATLLKVLSDGKYTGEEVFGRLFQKNGIHSMFRFLDEETNLAEEIKIMSSTPLLDFGKAFFQQL